jgi:hypothetical protein
MNADGKYQTKINKDLLKARNSIYFKYRTQHLRK